MTNKLIKQELDEWLDKVNYRDLNSAEYMPSNFSLEFMNFIKLVNGSKGEDNKTPPVHLKMLDKLSSRSPYIVNLMFRGASKTTVFMEYLSLYLGVFGSLPNFGEITGMIYVSDSIDNGVKNARANIEFRYENSEFLQEWIPYANFTEKYIEFRNKEGKQLGIKMYGAESLSLDSTLYTVDGTTTMGECSVGDSIFGPDGQLALITAKSEIFYKPMYEILLHDGRKLKVSKDHINSVTQYRQRTTGEDKGKMYFEDRDMTVPEILKYKLHRSCNGAKFFIKATSPLVYPSQDFPMDPYTLGLLLGDGRIRDTGNAELIAQDCDWETYLKFIPYDLGKKQFDSRCPHIITRTLRQQQEVCKQLGINVHGNFKQIPGMYLRGSVSQRTALLRGLMDSDGTAGKNGYLSYASGSIKLAEGVASLVRSLGGLASVNTSGPKIWKVGIKINIRVFELKRKYERQKYDRRTMARIESIKPIGIEPSQCISIDNKDRQYLTNNYTRTHNTGIRGSKIFGKRPTLAILDDLIGEKDAISKATMDRIKDTVYKGVNHAMDPNKRKIVFNGTPFNKDDVIVQAVESGAWDVNVWPVCERFPCTEEEFVGAWEDRFPYSFVKEQYDFAIDNGKPGSFDQELMLRISSEDDRLVKDSEIQWYKRSLVLNSKGNFNFYITTDFAVSGKQTADFSVISVWAYNSNGDWFWVDGTCERATMDKSINNLFRLVQIYKPQSVGIETNGQQGAFITWLQQEMITRNIWFNFASSSKSGEQGIRRAADKLSNFNLTVPWFKMHKMYFPEELRTTPPMREFINEVRLATTSGFKAKDDFIDTISMLAFMNAWRPSEEITLSQNEDSIWEDKIKPSSTTNYDSYIV